MLWIKYASHEAIPIKFDLADLAYFVKLAFINSKNSPLSSSAPGAVVLVGPSGLAIASDATVKDVSSSNSFRSPLMIKHLGPRPDPNSPAAVHRSPAHLVNQIARAAETPSQIPGKTSAVSQSPLAPISINTSPVAVVGTLANGQALYPTPVESPAKITSSKVPTQSPP
jgi:hypothetical protein